MASTTNGMASGTGRDVQRKRPTQLCLINHASTTSSDDGFIEYRVNNFRTLSSGRTIRGDSWGVVELVWITGLCYGFWYWSLWTGMLEKSSWLEWPSSSLIGRPTESATPISNLGLQLSTTRGISLPLPFLPRLVIPLSTSRDFTPLSAISTVVINEGVRRWSVEYYLAVVLMDGDTVKVVFDEIRPPLEVLKEVYHGIREILFNEYDDD
ncbi:phosphatidylinositol N-acetylglucosaminyltransferase subunit H, partial [Tremellales sp. Uapishka_1]